MITPADDVRRFLGFIRKVWAGSMGVVIALVVGFLLGIVYKQGDIIDDCKYAGSFRVHSQAFTCVRKI
jgi:hypothetical protein